MIIPATIIWADHQGTLMKAPNCMHKSSRNCTMAWVQFSFSGKMKPRASRIGHYSAPHMRETAKNINLLHWGSFLRMTTPFSTIISHLWSLFNCPSSSSFCNYYLLSNYYTDGASLGRHFWFSYTALYWPVAELSSTELRLLSISRKE